MSETEKEPQTEDIAEADLPGHVAPLWSVQDLAHFLGKSPRWVWRALVRRPDETGSIPCIRVGASPRFVPEHIQQWVLDGCPPAGTFKQWQEADGKRKRAS